MLNWAAQHGIRFLDDWTTARLTQWEASWLTLAPPTKQKTQERVITFFTFCVRQGWLEKNPALQLSPITVKQKPTGYFTSDQFEKLLRATSSFGRGSRDGKAAIWAERLRMMLLLMRWSGLRIGDAVTLERSRLVGNNIRDGKLFLWTCECWVPMEEKRQDPWGGDWPVGEECLEDSGLLDTLVTEDEYNQHLSDAAMEAEARKTDKEAEEQC